MRLLADENLDARIVARLRDAGHDVAEIRPGHAGSDDRAVLTMARRMRRILPTRDKDFGELVMRHGLRSAGLVLLRYRHGEPDATADAILGLIAAEGEALSRSFAVVEQRRARVLPLPG